MEIQQVLAVSHMLHLFFISRKVTRETKAKEITKAIVYALMLLAILLRR